MKALQNYEYKLLLLYIKYIPVLCIILQLIYLGFYIIGYDLYILVTLSGISVLPFIIVYKSLVVFKFCIFQKLVLMYNTIVDFLISIKVYMPYTLFITGIVLLVMVIKHKMDLRKSN